MNNTSFVSILFAMLFGPAPAIAADGKVIISSPAEGATVTAGQAFQMSYEADVGRSGNHLHLNVDGRRMDVIRQLKGSVEVEPLEPGKHRLCLLVNTKGHAPTGAEACINVEAK
jgi:hypothetical protein